MFSHLLLDIQLLHTVKLLRYSDISFYTFCIMNTYTPNQFLLKDFVKDTEQFHISRVNISGLGDLSFHTHDYAELFWVESGNGIHHINGKTVTLKPYDVVMIRPNDLHTFSSPKGDLTIVNVAFYTTSLDYYKNRYFPDSNSYFWTDKELPYHCNLRQDCISRFTARVESIMKKEALLPSIGQSDAAHLPHHSQRTAARHRKLTNAPVAHQCNRAVQKTGKLHKGNRRFHRAMQP